MSGDFLIAALAQYFGFALWFGSLRGWEESLSSWVLKILIFAFVLVLTTYFSELYSRERRFGPKEASLRISGSLILAFFTLSALYYLFPQISFSRESLILSLCAFGLVQFLWHCRYPILLKVPGIAQKVLILGAGPLALQMQRIMGTANNNYVLAGFVETPEDVMTVPREKIIGTMESLVDTAKREKINKIVISLSERRGVLPVRDILLCKFNGIEILDAMSFYEQITGKLMIEKINPSWFIFSDGFRVTPFMRFYKRAFDIAFALIGILVALPLMPIIALLIKIDSPGPVFFRQLRVGGREKGFLLYKFRTMCQDAESKTGAVWAQKNDPRVTRIGRILRKTRIDEIPQLFNVLKGDMSFVGPRPERPEFVEKLKEKIPYYSKRHSVKPGVTGWAQVRYPYGASVEDALEKLRYDLYYIKNYSLLLDFGIILDTVKVVLFGRGGQ